MSSFHTTPKNGQVEITSFPYLPDGKTRWLTFDSDGDTVTLHGLTLEQLKALGERIAEIGSRECGDCREDQLKCRCNPGE